MPVREFAKDIVNFYKVLPDDLFMGKPSTFEGIDEDDYYDEIEEEEIKKHKKKSAKAKKEKVPKLEVNVSAKRRGKSIEVVKKRSKPTKFVLKPEKVIQEREYIRK